MKPLKTILMAIFILLMLNSCTNILEEKDFISVYIVNKTEEKLSIYTGAYIFILSIPSATIPSGKGQSVLVGIGDKVSAYGKDKSYGSRTFYMMNSEWVIE
jgi:ABC-type uncharacterized transport system auxiliary subunit